MIALKDHHTQQEGHDSRTRTDQQGQGEEGREQQAHKDSCKHTIDDCRAQARLGQALHIDALTLVNTLHLLALCRLAVRLACYQCPLRIFA